jgi:beta-glucanase (GH16 family)
MILGLLTLFIVLPVISFTGTNLIPYSYETPLDQMPGAWDKQDKNSWAYVNDRTYPLLQNIRTGLIDPDTPASASTRKDINGDTLNLVFSDEFNEQNRTFYPGDDPFWFAPDFWYGATMDMEWYDPDAVNTGEVEHDDLKVSIVLINCR